MSYLIGYFFRLKSPSGWDTIYYLEGLLRLEEEAMGDEIFFFYIELAPKLLFVYFSSSNKLSLSLFNYRIALSFSFIISEFFSIISCTSFS